MNDITIIPGSSLTPLFQELSSFISTSIHGSVWRSGVGIPADNLGLDGDFYLNGNYNSGSGAPSTTPHIIAEEYLDTSAGKWYKAKGTSSSADWVALN